MLGVYHDVQFLKWIMTVDPLTQQIQDFRHATSAETLQTAVRDMQYMSGDPMKGF